MASRACGRREVPRERPRPWDDRSEYAARAYGDLLCLLCSIVWCRRTSAEGTAAQRLPLGRDSAGGGSSQPGRRDSWRRKDPANAGYLVRRRQVLPIRPLSAATVLALPKRQRVGFDVPVTIDCLSRSSGAYRSQSQPHQHRAAQTGLARRKPRKLNSSDGSDAPM